MDIETFRQICRPAVYPRRRLYRRGNFGARPGVAGPRLSGRSAGIAPAERRRWRLSPSVEQRRDRRQSSHAWAPLRRFLRLHAMPRGLRYDHAGDVEPVARGWTRGG